MSNLLTIPAADAHQHLRICRISLAISNPGATTSQMFESGETREQDIATWLKEMMSVARCNPHATAAPYLAANAMHMFAVNLRDVQTQGHVMEFLEEVEIVSGWPTEGTRQWLRVEWGWPALDDAVYNSKEYL
jgi:hypothetical protein